MKKLSYILQGLQYTIYIGLSEIKDIRAVDRDIENIAFDSRKIKEGYLFIAEKGEITDGHLYIDKAVSQGAEVVVLDNASFLPQDASDKHTIYIMVQDSSVALAKIACNYYENPSEKLNLVGVTGTNGKTTTVTLLHELFSALGYKCGKISTVENVIVNKVLTTERTTPDSITLNKLLHEMVLSGCQYVFMEVSSHSVVQNRITQLCFTGAVFSNITLDHLDYHKTFANYIKAKKKFFDELPKTAFALTNLDDKNGEVMLQNTKAKKYTYSLENAGANFKSKILESSFEGLDMMIDNREVFVPMVGKFNAYNVLAVYSTAILLGADKTEILTKLSMLKAAKGRFEIYRLKNGAYGIIDYAHTPDAVENVLNTINDCRVSLSQKIYTVIGCGGNRDRSKRPLMAEIAYKLSNILILTSDNPRDENPEDIINDMKQGLLHMDAMDNKQYFTITDRKEAIKIAISMAQKGDIILIAGKGHENYQEIKGVKHHFDDKEELMKGM